MQVKLPQPAEISYVEYGHTEVNWKDDITFLQIFIRNGPSVNCVKHRELTDGQAAIPAEEFRKIDVQGAVLDTFVLSGRFQSLTFRAVGAPIRNCLPVASKPMERESVRHHSSTGTYKTDVVAGAFVADPDPSQVNSWQALPDSEYDLRDEADLPVPASSPTAAQSPEVLPLTTLPEIFRNALAPLADYWEVVGMSLGGAWPDSLDTYLIKDTFGDLIAHAEELVAVLLEDTPDCPASTAAVERIRHRLRNAAASEADAADQKDTTVRLNSPATSPAPTPFHTQQWTTQMLVVMAASKSAT